jgi:hypothetical protein
MCSARRVALTGKARFPFAAQKISIIGPYCGHVFDQIPEWIKKESPTTRDLWHQTCPISQVNFISTMHFRSFGKNTSGIALLTNKTLDPSSPNFH